MSYAPAYPYRTGDMMVSPFVRVVSAAATALDWIPSFGATAWTAADVAQFVPIGIPEACTVTRLWWLNGSTISTPGNVDVGIFKTDGTLLTSAGSTTPSGTTNIQFVDITDYVLGRGSYYIGMTAHVANAANLTLQSAATSVALNRGLGIMEMASCGPPFTTNGNPAVLAACASLTKVFHFGLQVRINVG